MRILALVFLLSLIFSWSGHSQVVKNYTLQDINNNKVSLYELKGENLTVLDFWTTWCKPCRKAIPELNKIYDEFKEKGVQIVGVNCDGPRTTAQAPGVSRSLEIKYPVLVDVNMDIANSLNIGNFPTLIIIDEKNRVKYFHEGFVPGDEEDIIAAISKLLK